MQGFATRSLRDELLDLERRLDGVQVRQNHQILALEQKLMTMGNRPATQTVGPLRSNVLSYFDLHLFGVDLRCEEGIWW